MASTRLSIAVDLNRMPTQDRLHLVDRAAVIIGNGALGLVTIATS
jgi:hypothetical protein